MDTGPSGPESGVSQAVAAMSLLIERLARIVSPENVLTGQDVSSRFDGWPPVVPLKAACVVRPRTTEEVSAVLAICNSSGVAVVPHGGRTGLSGGTRAAAGDVVLSLERMNSIQALDRHNATMTVEAGVPLALVQEAADAEGLLYPVDLGARGSATMGGTIATNAGGNCVLRYGMTREQVLGLEVVLANGTVISSMNSMLKNNAGYDLKQLFIGSEGTLGVITRAVVRLRPRPVATACALIGAHTFTDVLNIRERMAADTDGTLSSFEVMWHELIDVVVATGRHRDPLSERHPYYVLVEVSAGNADQRLEKALAAIWDEGWVADAVIATSEAQAAALWAIREDSPARLSALRPAFSFDISLPPSAMEEYVDKFRRQLLQQWPNARTIVFGHVADGNLHITVGIGQGDEPARSAVGRVVYDLLRPWRGSVAAEHGVGLFKREYLDVTRTKAEINLMRDLKAHLDPRNTLNPGKIVGSEPTTRAPTDLVHA
jgi:FAD/FMN-containing dehydrogenase